jgi:hypothetical protein
MTAGIFYRFTLLDYHGGLRDLRSGVLRAPYPTGRSLASMWSEVFDAPDVRAERMRDEASDEASLLQTVWWIKSLRDDPLRLVRALRFSATLPLTVHPSFWRAVPFAVDALRTKVSGARKLGELRKIARAGATALLDFFELAFSPLAAYGDEGVAFGDALFGGPADSFSQRISVTVPTSRYPALLSSILLDTRCSPKPSPVRTTLNATQTPGRWASTLRRCAAPRPRCRGRAASGMGRARCRKAFFRQT